MAETTAFTAGTANETAWARMHRTVAPDGQLAHYLSAGTGNVTVSGTEVTVAPHAALVNGYEYVLDAPLTLDAADFGVAPTSGQTRLDKLVYQYDSARDPVDRIQMKIHAGVADTTPSLPNLTQTADLWEFERARYTWVYGSPISSTALAPQDHRTAGVTISRPGTHLPADVRSRLVVRGDAIWVADDADVKNTFAWRRVDSPEWTPADLYTFQWELYADARPMSWRLRGGVLELTGQVRLKASAGKLPIDNWYTVCHIPAASLDGVRTGQYTHVSAHAPSNGNLLSWRFIMPDSGTASLQVQSVTSTNLTVVYLSLFQIPIGA